MKTFTQMIRATLVLGLVTLCGCGGEVTGGETSSTSNSNSGGNVSKDWTNLVDGTWEMTAGKEGYWCTRKTITQDTYVTAFRADAPQGTHHTLLLVTEGGVEDGEQSCARFWAAT